MKCEKIIEKIVEKGGKILEEIVEKNETVSVHKTILQFSNMFFKIAFVNTPTKQFDVVKLYKYSIEEDWREWTDSLIEF